LGKRCRKKVPDNNNNEEIPEVGQIDELQTFIGQKKIKSGSGQL